MKNNYAQGSPDLILDFSNNYWNGKQVTEMTQNQK